jgi:SH3-like domain-containing protein
MPLLKVGISTSGEWYAVKDVDGDVNWIHKKLVTSRYRCAVVKTEEVNVRTGPGTSYSKCFFSPAKKYYSYRVLKRKGMWVKVRDESNNTGWIHRSYLWIQ